MRYEDYSAKVRPNATGGCEWYFYNLVVRPDAQGKHLVGKLVKPMLEYCAKAGRQAYLETHSAKNVEIYRHLGFNVVSNAPIPGTQVSHWGMAK